MTGRGSRRAAARVATATAVTVIASLATLTQAGAAGTPGGYSFNSATPIQAGSHHESLVVGDFLFWKVDVEAGQKISVKGTVDIPSDFPYTQGPRFVVNLYNPLRETIPLLDNPANQILRGTTHYEATSGSWTVGDGKKYENFDGAKGDFKEFKDDKYAQPGPYYIQVAVRGAEGGQRGIVVPVSLEVAVEGTVVQRPDTPVELDFGAPAPPVGAAAGADTPTTADQAAAPAAAKSDKGETSLVSAWGVPGGGALAAVLLAGLAAFAIRRRPGTETTSRYDPSRRTPPLPAAPAGGREAGPSWSPAGSGTPYPRTRTPVPPGPPAPESVERTGAFEAAAPPRPPAPPSARPADRTSWSAPTGATPGTRATPGSAPESSEATEDFEVPPRPPRQPPPAPPGA